MSPLDELQLLDSRIQSATDLGTLKPIFDRLDEISRRHHRDFEVQLVASDLRQRLINRGVELRRERDEARRRVAAATEAQQPSEAAAATNGDPAAAALPKAPPNLRRAVIIGAGIGVVGWLVLFVALVQLARNRNMPKAVVTSPGTVAIDIVTTPPGATIQINNQTRCTSNCRVNLPPGNYQVTAMLDGFDPAATGVTVIPGPPINVSLNLPSQAQTVRIFTDLPAGKVTLDGKPAPDLQDGQLVLDRVLNGKHEITVTGPNVAARFAFDLVVGKAPVLTAPIAATNVFAVIVGSFGGVANVHSSATPVKVALNGQPQGEIGPAGLELKNVAAGDHQLTFGEGPDQYKMVVPFGPLASLTAYLKSSVNSGTLVVSTGEDDVTVFINGREYRRKTKRGELRIQALGNVAVRVDKMGFQPEPEQRIEVKKGEEARLAFHLKPLPQVASLQIHGAAPGATVFIDDRSTGRIAADGSFSAANLPPGDRAIELRHDGFVPKRIVRHLNAGETVVLNGPELAMSPAVGTIHLVLSPPDAQVTYRRVEDAQTRSARDATLKLDPGNYLFIAKAPGYADRTERVPVVAGETRNVQISLSKEALTPAPKPTAVAASEWERNGWTSEDGQFVRRGGNRVVVRSGRLDGTFTFTANLRKAGGIFRGGRLRWFLEDGDNYSQYELDKKHFYRKDSVGGKNSDEKVPHLETDQKSYTIQIDISAERIVLRMRVGDHWQTLSTQPGRSIANGRFGFLIPGGDEIGISDFRFTPR